MPKPRSRSHLRFPLDSVLGNVGKVRVLRVIHEWPGPVSVRQIASETGMTPQGVRIVLESLVSDSLLDVLGDARTQLYTRRPDHPWTRPLADLFAAERQLWESVIGRMRAVFDAAPAVKAAWIYGSVARGEDRVHSDIDVAVLTEPAADSVKLLAELGQIEADHYVSISPAIFTETDLRTGRLDARWWQNVLRDGQQLKGSPRSVEMPEEAQGTTT